ncbi:hypothetical protein KQH21_31000 [Streptomyces sp. IpFD-1.1]|uniref:hypothetical protein n=1 Tax=unclassified Streptomyces TaxID=2593676 RepID=UPI0014367ED0|nr:MULTISPECIES: hypothetical protein [unclassified Streptomyces]MBV7255140.1 hypothetical protein [Streptomyces sp. S-2]MCO6752546.1 hypothetical protein [Streptomyces sp. IpFD-1.1]
MSTTETAPPPLPIDLEELPIEEVLGILHAAQNIYAAHVEATLPGLVRDEVREALARTDPDAVPLSATFVTQEWDNGLYWLDSFVEVALADGSTRALDLSEAGKLPGLLTSHAEDHEPNDSSYLLVTFEPLAMNVTS